MTAKSSIPLRFILGLLALAACANIAPLLLFSFGGDIVFHQLLIDCFGRQFWSGEIYPRWCFDANAGLGAPLFVFYAPLPYYVSTLFYPLTHLGASTTDIYLLSVWTATFVTGITAWLWLRELTTPMKALLGAIVYLYVPYRMEVMLFRSAYAELWYMAWLPLIFLHTRRLLQTPARGTGRLALVFGLCFVTHLPGAIIGVLSSALYVFIMAWRERNLTALWRYGYALVWGAALSAFYLVPAIFYKRFISTEGIISGHHVWSNDFLTLDDAMVRGHVVVTIALSLLCAFGLMLFCLRRRAKIEPIFCRTELAAWSVILLVASCMLFPFSKPVWDHMGFISLLAFPWRMQSTIALALVYFLVMYIQWLMSAKARKTWKGDSVMGFSLLVLLSLFLVSAPVPDYVEYAEDIAASGFLTQPEYRTIWTDDSFIGMEYILERYRKRAGIPRVETIKGGAKTDVTQWNSRAVTLHIRAKESSVLRLNLEYFPLWQAHGTPVNLAAERHTGQMLVDVPAGDSEVTLSASVHAAGWPVYTAEATSLLALFALALRWKQRRAHFS